MGPSDDAAPGGQIGGVHVEEGGCDEERVDIGVDDVSPLGFSAREALSALSGERSAPLAWSKGGSATATVAAGELVAARFVRSTVADSGPGGAESTAIAADCAARALARGVVEARAIGGMTAYTDFRRTMEGE